MEVKSYHDETECLTVAKLVNEFIAANDIGSDGGNAMYSTEKWKERGEDYGNMAVLVITHDGGCHADMFTNPYAPEYEKLVEYLGEYGYYPEQCTGWYSAIYRA